jgi:hypothetical protein
MGYLPPSLCMMELATRIDRNATARVSQYGILQVNRIFGIGHSAEEDASAMPLIQGSTPVVVRTEVDSRGRNVQRHGFGNNRYSGCTPAGPQNASSARDSRKHYARPDHNQRKFDPSIICDACKRRGHPASCWKSRVPVRHLSSSSLL